WGNMTDKTPTSGTGCTMLDVVVTTKNQISGAGYAYDAAGNMTQVPGISGTLTYDAENRLVTAAGATYTYDGDGRRVKKQAGGTTTTYYFGVDGQVMWEAVNNAGSREYIYLNGERLAGIRASDAHTLYHFKDHLGSLRVHSERDGSVTWPHDYYPYGEEYTNPTDPETRKFTGQERDGESGLDYFGARHYSSGLGRFVQVDPITPLGNRMSDPQRWNMYVYTRNNPLIFVDPDGRELAIVTPTDQSKAMVENALKNQRFAALAAAAKSSPFLFTIGFGETNAYREEAGQPLPFAAGRPNDTGVDLRFDPDDLSYLQPNPSGPGLSQSEIFVHELAEALDYVNALDLFRAHAMGLKAGNRVRSDAGLPGVKGQSITEVPNGPFVLIVTFKDGSKQIFFFNKEGKLTGSAFQVKEERCKDGDCPREKEGKRK
ncbi:MAG: hypothetical protein L0387_32215, partial [Acidobacteria bacterium]|nr:hypothetical protein [Acidobacteriota bacterium]